MKKITLLFAFLLATVSWQTNAQAVNEPAGWPNANWTVDVIAHTGANPQDIEADPTTADHFAYDDDDTGSGSHDEIAAESPVIDLTAAQAAGENNIIISGDYVYNNWDADEKLSFDYWDADANAWVTFFEFPHADTSGAPVDDFCSGTPESYEAILGIGNFTATQLSGFKYRIYYSDDITGANAWNYGFCFAAPTLISSGFATPSFELTVVPDCANNQFNVTVNVTDLGGAASVTISDDQGSTPQQVTATGSVDFGPYSSGTIVSFSVTNDQDTSYTSSDSISFVCPPANDTCTGAISFTLDENACSNSINVSNEGTTDSGEAAPSCGSYQASATNGDLWYMVTIPADVTEITLDVANVTGLTSVAGAFYSGTCGSLTEESCTQFSSGWPWTISGLTSGDTYYLRVWDYGNDQLGTFDLCGYYTVTAISENRIAGFQYYPNPVNNILNLSANDHIEQVNISNIAGQEVLKVTPNNVAAQIDMSHLPNGMYFVKAQVNGELTAFKIVKK